MTTSPKNPADSRRPDTLPGQQPEGSAFGWTYWMLNSIEAFERLAYFGIRAVVPIYIMQATEPGGLHLTAVHKGVIYAWWAIFQSWLPMFTGGIADRYGYKRTLSFAITANVIGYVMMAYMASYHGFFAGILVLAIGTAFFKPALQGSIAQNLTKENSSMGWGIFYWVVNIGAFAAPILATLILGKPHSAEGWRNLFLTCAGYTAINLLLLFTFKDVASGADKSLSLGKVFWNTIENISFFWFRGGTFVPWRGIVGLALAIVGIVALKYQPIDLPGYAFLIVGGLLIAAGVILPLWLEGGVFTWQLRLPAFLGIMSCFWMMMYQVWDLHPNFIEDWVDSSKLAKHVPVDSWWEYGDRGLIRVPQQILLNLNALLIIILVMPLSYVVRKMRTLSAMLIGMTVATMGTVIAGVTGHGEILLLGIMFFSFGEMLTGPKKNQYLSLIAPPGKKGLYLGYVNIPVGVGVGLGSLIAGFVYDSYGEKATLALKHLGANQELLPRAVRSVDWSDSLALIPELGGFERDEAITLAQRQLGQDANEAADTLRRAFRFDQGQIINLSLQYLVLEEELRGDAQKKLAEALVKVKKEPLKRARTQAEVEAKRVSEALQAGTTTLDAIGVARYVDYLPDALGRKRTEVLDIVRDRVNKNVPEGEKKGFTEVTEILWTRFGDDPQVLNNLALEYLAQATDQVSAGVDSKHFEDPVKEMEKAIGIGRTKSFSALNAALGADQAAVDAALGEIAAVTDHDSDRAYVYLAQRPHLRFLAIGRRDWSNDVSFLRALIENDAGAKQEAEAKLSGSLDYTALAGEQDFVRAALDKKDWKKAPLQAAQLLGLNPYEARAMVAAELNEAPEKSTHMLWATYHPQYKVWIPFASIGVLATIALAIFGQMAKRWTDMNA